MSEKQDKENLYSLDERRGAQAARPKTKLTPTLMRKRPEKPPPSSPLTYRLAVAFQIVVIAVGGYLFLRSCGLAK